MRMKTVLALALAAGLAGPMTVLAEPSGEGEKKAEQPAAAAQTPGTPAAATPAEPAAPQGVPVPDGPVVKKTELEGGLVLEDITIGEGPEVKDGASVVAHYHGTLKADPTKVFDSSFERGEPVAFPLANVIPGWQKGVPGMKVGGVRRLIIPAALAYGERSPSPEIPANSDLVFVIKLIDAVTVEDIKVGEGEAATGQCVAVTNHVITDADGKEIEKTEPGKWYIWFPGEPPVAMGLEGMKVGGKRKIRVPKEFNRANPMLPAGRPSGVPLTVEFELVAVRSLQPRR